MVVKQNSDFLFGFEAVMTNSNGDPDQENKPRMDYETNTALVSDARRKRDIREFIKTKGYRIFVDTLADKKVPMDKMFQAIRDEWLEDHKFQILIKDNQEIQGKWNNLVGDVKSNFKNAYIKIQKEAKAKPLLTDFNNIFLTTIIKKSLIDIRWFGSAMAIENISRTYTGPVQLTWGYSLHPVELVKSNTITSIMNDDSSTFGKKHKLYYALNAHYGTINKHNAKRTGMTEQDKILFQKSLVQGMMSNQTDSKQGQTPMFYLEVLYKPEFDGYLGDLRRFLQVSYQEKKAIRSLEDLTVDFSNLNEAIETMKQSGYVEKVIGWVHPLVNDKNLTNMPQFENIDLWEPIANLPEER